MSYNPHTDRNPRLDEAVAIFTELGWADASPTDALTLPLGTGAQQKAALAGLRSGHWRWRKFVDVDIEMLWLFAVRVGVSPRRAVETLDRKTSSGPAKLRDDIAFAVLAERGPEFARVFVKLTYFWPAMRVRLAARHQLAVLDNRDYLADWERQVMAVLGCVDDQGPDQVVLDEDVARDRFVEHVRACVETGLSGTGQTAQIVAAAVAQGWLDRDGAVELVLGALDAAGRPGERKTWTTVWLDDLHATAEEIVTCAETLVPVLAHGDAVLVERLGLVLIAGVSDKALSDVVAVSLTVPTKKTLRAVLGALAGRPRPSAAVLETVGPQVMAVDAGHDRALAGAVQAVVDAWGLEAGAAGEPTTVEEMWRPAPPVWAVPRFDHGEETPEALTQAAAEISAGNRSDVVDVAVERFLAVANAVARRDPALVRAALAGVGNTWSVGLCEAWAWANDEPGKNPDSRFSGDWAAAPLAAREFAVFQRLGEVPCLLSEPSTVDLRVHPADLLVRLRAYEAEGAGASEADLFLALTRLDVVKTDDAVRAGLDEVTVPVLLQSGELMVSTAGSLVSRYLADPVVEPSLTVGSHGWCAEAVVPVSLRDFPPRLGCGWSRVSAVFPNWGDAAALVDPRHPANDDDFGVALRQVARRAEPLTPGAAVNLLVAPRVVAPTVASMVSVALDETWERGLLRPGVADVRYLDWVAEAHHQSWVVNTKKSTPLAATARTLGDIARTGLLAVVWPVLDDLLVLAAAPPHLTTGSPLHVQRSSSADLALASSGTCLPAGTVEVVEVVAALLPEVQHAVTTGVADHEVLDLPGVRALAARGGTSRAVTIATDVVAQLPVAAVPVAAAAEPPPVPSGPGFEEIWPEGAGTVAAVVDQAELAAVRADRDGKTVLRLVVSSPRTPGVSFQVVDEFPFLYGRQCEVEKYDTGAQDPGRWWLSWDNDAGRLVATEGPREAADTTRPRATPPDVPLSTSLVAVALGLVARDGKDGLSSESDLVRFVGKGLIGSAAARIAVVTLLGCPEVSPAKLVRVLEKHPETLSALWPLLAEPVRVAGTTEGPVPTWLNRVLDVALLYADHLREAARRGLIPEDAAAWPGLAELAARPGKSAALAKARSLLAAVRDGGRR
ncbi:MAG: hypothetical protein FWH11_12010 [Micrococcales bacterium]|nr:hypothetical protein [Micrococcales bacterium]